MRGDGRAAPVGSVAAMSPDTVGATDPRAWRAQPRWPVPALGLFAALNLVAGLVELAGDRAWLSGSVRLAIALVFGLMARQRLRAGVQVDDTGLRVHDSWRPAAPPSLDLPWSAVSAIEPAGVAGDRYVAVAASVEAPTSATDWYSPGGRIRIPHVPVEDIGELQARWQAAAGRS